MGNKSKKEKVQDGVHLQEVRKTESGFLKNETIKSHLLALALIGFSAMLAYANSLNGTWALDDVVINRPISIQDFQDLLGFRKITYLTFLANQRVASFSAMNFRIVNIVIHLANAILVYVLTFWTVRSFLAGCPAAGNNRAAAPDGETFNQRHHDRLAFAAALLCSALFALHPINVSAVAYIVQRMALLAAFFVLLALLFYRAAAESTHPARSSLLFMLCGASLLLGLFSKENAVMGLPLILLYDYVFLSKKDMRSFKKRLAVIGVLAVLVLGVTAYSLRLTHVVADLASLVVHYDQPMEDRGWMAADVYWTPLQHVLTQFRVLPRYLFLLLVPAPGFFVFDWWGFPLSSGLMTPPTTVAGALLIVALIVFSLAALKRLPLLSFGILWYLAAISLESFVGIGADLYFEHRNYLPVAGLFMGAAGQAIVSLPFSWDRTKIWIAAILVCVTLGSVTFVRNAVWKDSLTLWNDTLDKAPGNIRAIMALGNTHMNEYDLKKAEEYFKKAILIAGKERRPFFFDEAVYSLGMLYLFSGKIETAKKLIDQHEKSMISSKTQIMRGLYKASTNDVEGALREYGDVINRTQGIETVIVYTLTGDAYRKSNLWDDALVSYERALAIDSRFSGALYGMASSYIGKRDIRAAYEYFQKTLSVDPGNVLALSDFADLLVIERAERDRALDLAGRAVSKDTPFYQPYLTMGNVLTVVGRENEAEPYYKAAVNRGMAEYLVSLGKARAYYIRGEQDKAQHHLSELRRFGNLPDEIRKLLR